MKPTQQRIKELLRYEPETGLFFWLVRRGPLAPGSKAGTFTDKRYVDISVDCKLYKAHRLAWLYVHGVFPPDQIDHINGNRSDNRIANLRPASNGQNRKNATAYGRVRLKGVVAHVSGGFVARIQHEGRRVHLGYFKDAVSAAEAYDRAATASFGEFALTNRSLGLLGEAGGYGL